jgi:hypothetical protein
MAGRFNAVQPTTRNGYLFGARRENIPWESEGPDTGRRFQQGRATRMAGQKDISDLQLGYKDAPQGVGRGFVPKDSDAWETQEKDDAYTQDDPWRTFEEDLDPKVARW